MGKKIGAWADLNLRQKQELIDAADEAGVPMAYLVRLCLKGYLSTIMEEIRATGLPPDPLADGQSLITKPFIPEVAPIVSAEPVPPIAGFLSSGVFTVHDASAEAPYWTDEQPEEEPADEPSATPEPSTPQRVRKRRSG